ncbi:4-phosphoerythronate dehydrogenase [Thiomicrorhabdus sediminis]|uniref:Erythronate-4-phosphate dehydrogenase n=1 Tax=Thiomicrorhabdus sediminis TaxID=2580412 RepID=A0A4P9K8S5_9GAMM|nr:4-phosphoerythronate dehydrogenase [Thiomicrorhabdus sediminis]QCU90727.1 4-phosphoerythronate dehydrogenase [Thiomicrorhabdus sediminis]
MTKKTLVIDDAVPYAKEIFSHLGEVITLPGRDICNHHLLNADALIVRSRTQVNESLLKNTAVKYVGSTVVGLDHIDQHYLSTEGITFYSAQGCNANSVAEYVITILFQLAEHFGFDLSRKTLAIIGVGNVGSRVYSKAKILGIECLLNDPPKIEANPDLLLNEPYTDLDTCLKADIITVHTPLTSNGKHPTLDLISAEKLKRVEPHQIIINAARGGIINEAAWSKTKTLANIIDCWENEPYIDKALYDTAFIATPHIAGHSLDAKVAGSSMVYGNLCKHWQITPDKSWQKALPKSPEPIEIQNLANKQATLCQIFSKTHNPQADDLAIRSENHDEVEKKYEKFRRNFPVYREWQQQKVLLPSDKNLCNTLLSLGFRCH